MINIRNYQALRNLYRDDIMSGGYPYTRAAQLEFDGHCRTILRLDPDCFGVVLVVDHTYLILPGEKWRIIYKAIEAIEETEDANFYLCCNGEVRKVERDVFLRFFNERTQ